MTLILDTNVCIELLRGRNAIVAEAYESCLPETILLPSIVIGELLL